MRQCEMDGLAENVEDVPSRPEPLIELASLLKDKPLPKASRIRDLHPFLDNDGMLRIKTRLDNTPKRGFPTQHTEYADDLNSWNDLPDGRVNGDVELFERDLSFGDALPPGPTTMPTDGSAVAAEHARRKLRHVEGIPISGFHDESLFRAALCYEPRDDEVFVAGYPKSGTTWVHFVTRRLLHRGHESPAESAMQCLLSSIIGYTGGLTPEAVIKTHLPFGRAPFSEKARYIYVLRNPYDCCVSYYHHRAWMAHSTEASFDEFLADFIDGQVPFGDYFDHLATWYPETSRPNVMCVPYEQLKEDVGSGILRIADFLGEELGNAFRNDDGALEKIIETTSPRVMRKHFSQAREALFTSPNDQRKAHIIAAFRAMRPPLHVAGAASEGDATPFRLVRKATVGDWKNYFSAAQTERMKINIDIKMACRMADHQKAVLALWENLNLP
ncbi:hypothetical protein MTO96_037110 [Rhipicephalus appendiculatus]